MEEQSSWSINVLPNNKQHTKKLYAKEREGGIRHYGHTI